MADHEVSAASALPPVVKLNKSYFEPAVFPPYKQYMDQAQAEPANFARHYANAQTIVNVQLIRNQINHAKQLAELLKQTLPGPAVSGRITVKEPTMSYELADDKKVALVSTWQDAKGNAAKVDGDPVWESSDPAIATIEKNADGTVFAVGQAPGQCQIKATADADLGAGNVAVPAVFDLVVVAGQAVGGVVQPQGEAVPQ